MVCCRDCIDSTKSRDRSHKLEQMQIKMRFGRRTFWRPNIQNHKRASNTAYQPMEWQLACWCAYRKEVSNEYLFEKHTKKTKRIEPPMKIICLFLFIQKVIRIVSFVFSSFLKPMKMQRRTLIESGWSMQMAHIGSWWEWTPTCVLWSQWLAMTSERASTFICSVDCSILLFVWNKNRLYCCVQSQTETFVSSHHVICTTADC